MRGGRLRELPIGGNRALTGQNLVFWIGGRLYRGGGRLQEVVAHGGSTVLLHVQLYSAVIPASGDA